MGQEMLPCAKMQTKAWRDRNSSSLCPGWEEAAESSATKRMASRTKVSEEAEAKEAGAIGRASLPANRVPNQYYCTRP